MKICRAIQAADAKEMRRQGELAFTMIEIAIAIGVIGFALVAIIGILPTGMNVQKDNREDTVISQDAPYFLDAIRNGAPVNGGVIQPVTAQGLDFLTNYVQSIQFNYYEGTNVTTITFPNEKYPTLTGAEIVGLLTTPQTNYGSPGFYATNFEVAAIVRALSGPATAQQSGPNSGLNSFMAFTYKMEVMISPFNNFAPASTNWNINGLDSYQSNICYNRWLEATNNVIQPNQPMTTPGAALPPYPGYGLAQPIAAASGALSYNLFDVRLRFSWPVLPNGNVGPGRQTYRTLVSGQMLQASANGVPGCYFFQPQTFANTPPPGL